MQKITVFFLVAATMAAAAAGTSTATVASSGKADDDRIFASGFEAVVSGNIDRDSLQPRPGSVLTTTQHYLVSARYALGPGATAADVRLRLDGADITASSGVSETSLTVQPDKLPAAGEHQLELVAGTDRITWSFLAVSPPVISSLTPSNTTLPAGSRPEIAAHFDDVGSPIDMGKVQVPAYVVAGITDHITPWQACYQSKNILRGKIDFVLSSSGHIQSIVNPPTNPKAKYFLNPAMPDAAEDWLASASEHAGSWWDHWAAWYRQHGGGEVPAPRSLGRGPRCSRIL